MISVDRLGQVALVRLDRGVTNAINLDGVNELAAVIQEVKDEPDVWGLVLGSTNDKFFSIGFDIPHLFDLTKEDFDRFYRAFNRLCLELYTLPKPTVASITGHAIAGGCILALCCDYRYIAAGRKLMGLNEIKLGVPVPYVADCVLQALVGTRNARDILDSGEFFTPKDSIQLGLADRILPPDQVEEQALAQAELLGSQPAEAFGTIKLNRTEPVTARITGQLERKEALFIDLWYSEPVRERLRSAMERF